MVAETTALGAAYAAGLATGFWKDTDELRENWHEAERWEPRWTDEQRAKGYAGWQKAVQRTLDWVDVRTEAATSIRIEQRTLAGGRRRRSPSTRMASGGRSSTSS